MYIPFNNSYHQPPLDLYDASPVFIDSRITFVDPFYMSHQPTTGTAHPSDQEDLYNINDDPTISQQKFYSMMTSFMPTTTTATNDATSMRRHSSSSTVTMTTCSSSIHHHYHYSNNNNVMDDPSTGVFVATSSSSASSPQLISSQGMEGQDLRGSSSTTSSADATILNTMQDKLDTLYDEWISVDIVYRSLQTAFPVRPLVHLSHEERLEDIDRELSIAYDDLMTQVRRLYRQINRLSREMAQYNIQQDELRELQHHLLLQQQTPQIYATAAFNYPSSGAGLTPP
ncbi:hypothetical protein BDA99DRAFT_496858 [Phascolomyces articulosus]|uniref:Uncharacterized protein n=1 Tax=Phascolomyces articulosus TaxID=60185 RepID=A0AAD5PJB7_9FUNG|nr:hypothetical protein BDA99DRAFT_496858 [Phascolomyces articulosus]